MRTNRLTLIACACVAWLFGCAGAPEEETELGTAEQPVVSSLILDNVTLTIAQRGKSATPTTWSPWIAAMGGMIGGLVIQHNNAICGFNCTEYFPTTCTGDVCMGPLQGKWVDFVLDNPHSDATHLATFSSTVSHVISGIDLQGRQHRGGVTVSLNDAAIFHQCRLIIGGSSDCTEANQPTVNNLRNWATCRAIADWVGVKNSSDPNSCTSTVPTTVAALNARQAFSPQDINDFIGTVMPRKFGVLDDVVVGVCAPAAFCPEL